MNRVFIRMSSCSIVHIHFELFTDFYAQSNGQKAGIEFKINHTSVRFKKKCLGIIRRFALETCVKDSKIFRYTHIKGRVAIRTHKSWARRT